MPTFVLKLRWFVLILGVLCLSACSSVLSTAKTTKPLTLTSTNLPPLTQVALETPTPHVVLATTTSRFLTPPSTPTPTTRISSQPTSTLANALDVDWKDVTAVPVEETLPLAGSSTFCQVVDWQITTIAVFYSPCTGEERLIDTTSGKSITPTPYPTPDPSLPPFVPRVFSPNREYFVECAPESAQLYRTADSHSLSQTPLSVAECYETSSWASTPSLFAFLADGRLYFWGTDGTVPEPVNLEQDYFDLAWSPNGKHLLLLGGLVPGEDGSRALNIIDAYGKPAFTEPLEVFWKVFDMYWQSDEVFVIYYGCGTACTFEEYYALDSGRLLAVDASHHIENYNQVQSVSRSPNRRWLVFDRSFRNGAVETYWYELLDTKSAQIHSLTKGSSQHLAFVAWKDDGSAFYLVSRPVVASSLNDPNVPFGLLALNPETREFTQFFEQAVFAKLSPDNRLAWVVFPARRDDGSLGMDGGVFDLATGSLVGRSFVADEILYANPAEGDLVPVAWSGDGKQLVFGDSRGNLILVGIDGVSKVLASNLSVQAWPNGVQFEWSPDNHDLLVQYGDQAWIIKLSNF